MARYSAHHTHSIDSSGAFVYGKSPFPLFATMFPMEKHIRIRFIGE